jgi:hypothetical protein
VGRMQGFDVLKQVVRIETTLSVTQVKRSTASNSGMMVSRVRVTIDAGLDWRIELLDIHKS